MAGFSQVGQQPLAASTFPSDFDAATNALVRQRRLADLLQQQAFQPDAMPTIPGAKLSPLSIMAKALGGGLGAYQGNQADIAEKANAQARQDALEKLLSDGPPQGTAAQDAIPMSPGGQAPLAMPDDNSGAPPAPPVMVPFPAMGPDRPAIAAQPAPLGDQAKHWGKFLPLGPAGAKIAESGLADVQARMMPKAPGLMAVGGDIFDPATKTFTTGPSTLANQALAKSKAEEDAQLKRDRLNADTAYREDMIQSKYDLHKVLGAIAGAGNTTDVGVDATNGMPVVRGKDGRRYTMDNATGKATPYTGEVIPQATHEKNVAGASLAENEAVAAEHAAKLILDPKAADAYSTVNRGKVGAGLSPSQAGISPEGQKALAFVGRDFAENTKRLYGASFTDSEQKRASGFTITGKDDAAAAALKAQNAADFARKMALKYGGAAAAAAARRMGSGAAPTGNKSITVDY